ncbi:hypothetical protein Rhe02_49600 [Rhizocola hellebori]|uniref:DUF4871 domain-containing protein n=1 Tax=Rhizocola hellebori TaxID=1392758 RepID=A0A8J3QC18_9ACTN|nr:hypothetical protein Rhe02_49600 [Rhizocola hellebori]
MACRIAPAAIVVLAGCTPASPSPQPASPTPRPTRTVCGSPVEKGPLPEWAQAGFSGDSSMPHVMGDQGEIVAAIFAYPLAVVRPDGSNNKILWVPKTAFPTGDLVIEARLDGSDVSANRSVPGGPGPSIIDLPQPGCWRLTLTWPEHTDTMDLVYQ